MPSSCCCMARVKRRKRWARSPWGSTARMCATSCRVHKTAAGIRKVFLSPSKKTSRNSTKPSPISRALLDTIRGKGVALDRILLGGFAEGACVLSEFLVRNPKSYGGLMILTGGLMDHTAIGKRPGSGLLAVPTYVSGSENGQEVPVQRIRDTIRTLQAGGALIRSHIFTERPFLISDEEKVEMRKLIMEAIAAAEP